ncbi:MULTISPECIES: hypothetical protein [Roseomonadaceae]|uniref:Uncharacterized protein n=1 Tax=Falsiroseomonas oleicola TaxID=2801474 RepID=A0ABS6H5R6_9PROT|nr:hypothetical protein [Roseomonas oleicola]MBU8544037.1 hypothetical protein [Roseomonas oleicola]
MTPASKAAHRRVAQAAGQQVWIAFGGVADQPWMRLLRPGFRHCFAALSDEAGWTVIEPLTGRLMVARLPVDAGFDLPGFYRRAGLRVLGPFLPEAPMPHAWPLPRPLSCVGLCQALLGPKAPPAWTPFQLFQALGGREQENNHG